MAFTLTEVEVSINFYETETCWWDFNDDDYADIDKRTQALAEELGNK